MSAGELVLRGRRLGWRAGHPLVMGIVNANAGSFSDSGPAPTASSAIARGLELLEQGADLIDVGGESGVTYSAQSDPRQEIARVAPVIEALVAAGAAVSIDTYKPAVAAAALDLGACLVNDVSGLRDPQLARLAAAAGAGLVVMHTRAEPKRAHFPEYADVVADVLALLTERLALAREAGVAADALIADPGPDFAKRPHESIACLRGAGRLAELGVPWLAAVSRKYFLAAVVPRPPAERGAMTLAAVAHAADHGAAVVRVHDVAATTDFLAARDVLAGRRAPAEVDPGDERLKWNR